MQILMPIYYLLIKSVEQNISLWYQYITRFNQNFKLYLNNLPIYILLFLENSLSLLHNLYGMNIKTYIYRVKTIYENAIHCSAFLLHNSLHSLS